MRGVPRDGIQFVIAHDRTRDSRVDHACGLPLSIAQTGAACLHTVVNGISSDEDRLPLQVAPRAGRVAIADPAQQSLQLVGLPCECRR